MPNRKNSTGDPTASKSNEMLSPQGSANRRLTPPPKRAEMKKKQKVETDSSAVIFEVVPSEESWETIFSMIDELD